MSDKLYVPLEKAQSRAATMDDALRLRDHAVPWPADATTNREALVSDVVDWLVATDFPYDWNTSVPAPAALRTLLAEAYSARDGESVDDWINGLALEQKWSDNA